MCDNIGKNFDVQKGDIFTGESTYSFPVSSGAQALTQEYIIKEFSFANSPGLLNITFVPKKGNKSYAFVNGIEIVSIPDLFNMMQPMLARLNFPYNIDSSITLETMIRLNVGGQSLSPVEDSDFRRT